MKFIISIYFIISSIFICNIAYSSTADICYKCHDKSNFLKSVRHSPVAQGDCDVCHNPHVAKFDGLLRLDSKQLCLGCHPKFIVNNHDQEVVHGPVADGNCIVCHNPHSSSSKGLLKEKNQKDSCLSCHINLKEDVEYSHKPFQDGLCTVCHQAHKSQHRYLLLDDSDQLCRKCHTGNLKSLHNGYPDSFGSCLSCHNPHGSNQRFLIKNYLHEPYVSGCDNCHNSPGDKVETNICLQCHGDVGEQLLAVQNHLNNTNGNSCIHCHSPHASDTKTMLKGSTKHVCKKCHGDTFKNFVNKQHKHPNVETCSNCHDVHGSNFLGMLKGDGNQVCEGCHKSQGQFTHPVGLGVSDPRSGVMMTCVSCHYPHGSDYPFELKLEGSKELCIQCHQGY